MELGFRFLLNKWDFVIMPQKNEEFSKFITSYINAKEIPSSMTPYDPKTESNKYGMAVFSAPLGFATESTLPKLNIVLEGQNEKGLSISALVLNSATYQLLDDETCSKDEDASTCSKKTLLSWLDFVPYLLARCATAEEAIKELEKTVVYRPPEASSTGIHWALDDANGDHYIVEYLNNQLVWHKSDLGVMTNDPGFSWQVQNLNRYGYVSAPKPEVPKGMQFKQPSNVYPEPLFQVVPSTVSHGTGIMGLPGDISPPSRFVKLFFMRGLSEMNAPPTTYKEALALANNLIQTVAIPYGSVGGKADSAADDGLSDPLEILKSVVKNLFTDTEMTQWTVLKVPRRNVVFYRDYVNSNLKEVDLSKLDFSKGGSIKKWKVHDKTESFGLPV